MASKRKGPMAVDKSQTPLWMRVVIVLVAVSFVGMLVPIVLGLGGGNKPSGSASGGLFANEYQPRVDAALAALQTNPNNPDIIAQVGHAYYEWAAKVFESGQQPASIPLWNSAVSYYDQVLAIRPDDDVVLGNKAFALYYAGDPKAQAALQAFVDAAADNQTLAPQVENAKGMLAQIQSSAPATTTP
jgi:tetratricopeptide (TPR) repeat protein